MQIVSDGDILHEMSKPVFLEKIKKIFLYFLKVLPRVLSVNSQLWGSSYPPHQLWADLDPFLAVQWSHHPSCQIHDHWPKSKTIFKIYLPFKPWSC